MDLFNRMCNLNEVERIKSGEVLQHPWITKGEVAPEKEIFLELGATM